MSKMLVGVAAIFLIVIVAAAMDVHAQYTNQTETSLPDLETIDVGIGPGPNDDIVSVGENIALVRFPISNKGTAHVGSFEYEISIYDTAVQDISLCTLTKTHEATPPSYAILSGGTITSDDNIVAISCPKFTKGGTYAVRVRLDPNNKIVELNENNNIAIKTFPVGSGLSVSVRTESNLPNGPDADGGYVVSSDGKIDCVRSGLCFAYYNAGNTVALKAVPYGAAKFIGWSGDCSGSSLACTVSIDANKQSEVIATFTEQKPTPIIEPQPSGTFSLSISTDKYYYTLGEQVKISGTLTGNGNLGNAVVTAVISYTPECPTGYGCAQALVLAEKITLNLIGAVAPACEYQEGGVTTCPTTQSYYYVGYYTPNRAGTYNIDATANVNGITLSDSAGFQVSKIQKEEYDSVDLSISPEEQKTIVGEPVTYALTVTDKHKAFNNCPEGQPCMGIPSRAYTYNLEIFGLPYPSSFSQSSVTLDAGASTEVKLTVYPSSTAIQQTVTAVAVQAQTTAQQTVTGAAEPAAPTARPQTEAVTVERLTTKVTGQQIAFRRGAPDVVTVESEPVKESATVVASDETYQSTVQFTVKATQSDNDRNADKANAVLHVYYYRPPQPPEEPPDLPEYEEVTLVFEKGWNLINLPGEFVRTTESSSCGELGGFVYFPGRGYVKLDKSRDIIGDRFVEYFSTHSFWVRAKQPCKVTFEVSNFASYSGLELKSGWNFLGTTKDMVGETLNNIKGTCSIEKAYTFSTSGNKWGRFGTDNLITTPYKGIVVKTSGQCTLGENTILPPALPEEEPQTEPLPVVKSFLKIKNEKECVARGGAVAEKAPPVCIINGKTYEIEEW